MPATATAEAGGSKAVRPEATSPVGTAQIIVASAPTPRPTPAPTSAGATTAELRMLVLMNASRVGSGLALYALDAALSTVARLHSAAEVRAGFVFHDGVDGTARARDTAACGSGWYGENTGKVWNGDVDRLHQEFMSEPMIPIDHRTNIMDGAFRRVGIGAAAGADALYITVVFCR